MNTSARAAWFRGGFGLRWARFWVRHLQRDIERDWTIPWTRAVALSPCERKRIARSIAEFQRGESSEARHYLAQSARFAGLTSDPAFHRASQLFVQAENIHATILGRFMAQAGIARCRRSFADGVFRWLRKLADLGWMSRALLVAELIAQEYYPCLREATNDATLRRICDRVISEEAGHIRFQLERICRVEAAHSATNVAVRDRLLQLLMMGTACVVYLGHGRVLGVRWSIREFFGRAVCRQRRALARLRALRAAAVGGTDAAAACPALCV